MTLLTNEFCGLPLSTRQDAIAAARSIIEGRTSRYWNTAIEMSDGGVERVQAITACAQADAADVQMLVAFASVLPDVAPEFREPQAPIEEDAQ